MEEQNKKISFGFSKLSKKPIIFGKSLGKEKKVDLIECLESQTIKIKNAKKEVKGPLIIPMVQSAANILDRRKNLIKSDKLKDSLDDKPDSELTVDELAARELIKDVQNLSTQKTNKVFVLPNVAANVIEIEGKEESTLQDYESVPISDYGLAMLRGMGWTEEVGIGKNSKKIKMVEPPLRPKGMGLGASQLHKDQKSKPALDKNGKELILCKGSFAKITDGKKKGCYCEVQGFDDEAGRIIVKTSLDGLVLSLNEFLVTPVTKEEYDKSSKVINIVKYEEYKNRNKKEDEHQHTSYDNDRKKSSSQKSKKKSSRHKNSSSDDEKSKKKSSRHKNSSSDDEKSKKKSSRHKNSSSDDEKSKKKSSRHKNSSSDDDSDYERRRNKNSVGERSHDYDYKKHKSKKKSHKHKRYTNDSESDHEYKHKKNNTKFDKHVYTKR